MTMCISTEVFSMKNMRKANKKQGKNFIKYLIGIFMVVATVGISFGSWLFLSVDSNTYFLTSETPDNPLSFTYLFRNVDINASNEWLNASSSATITNTNSNITLQITFDEVFTDTELNDTCDITNDCNMSYSWRPANNGGGILPIFDNDVLIFPSGNSQLFQRIDCKPFSCSQSVEIITTIQEPVI